MNEASIVGNDVLRWLPTPSQLQICVPLSFVVLLGFFISVGFKDKGVLVLATTILFQISWFRVYRLKRLSVLV